MNALSVILFAPLFAASQCAFAIDLFESGVPREEVKRFSKFASATMGGYALYDGGLTWEIVSTKTNLTNNLNIKIGQIHMTSGALAQMFVSTNLSQVMENGFYSGNPCDARPSTIHTNNKSAGKKDNCMTISPLSVNAEGRDHALILVNIRNSQSNWRLYNLSVVLNPAVIGFPNTLESDWSNTNIALDQRKKQFMGRLTTWADKLQDAVNIAIGYDKPQDSFSKVPSIQSLADSNTKINTASN